MGLRQAHPEKVYPRELAAFAQQTPIPEERRRLKKPVPDKYRTVTGDHTNIELVNTEMESKRAKLEELYSLAYFLPTKRQEFINPRIELRNLIEHTRSSLDAAKKACSEMSQSSNDKVQRVTVNFQITEDALRNKSSKEATNRLIHAVEADNQAFKRLKQQFQSPETSIKNVPSRMYRERKDYMRQKREETLLTKQCWSTLLTMFKDAIKQSDSGSTGDDPVSQDAISSGVSDGRHPSPENHYPQELGAERTDHPAGSREEATSLPDSLIITHKPKSPL